MNLNKDIGTKAVIILAFVFLAIAFSFSWWLRSYGASINPVEVILIPLLFCSGVGSIILAIVGLIKSIREKRVLFSILSVVILLLSLSILSGFSGL